MSNTDYCNSLLYGIPDKLLNRIQRIRVYPGLYKFSHITPALATLNGLPVNPRNRFQNHSLVYKAQNGQGPA